MKIQEAAKLAGVTVRTLQYYDKIGLLKPQKLTDANYRIYGKDELERLQQILFFRELDFPLNEIKDIMENPNYDRQEILRKQKELLIKKRNRLEGLITLVDQTLEGVNEMSFEEFDMTEIERCREEYAKEVKERWSNTDAYKESEKKTKAYTKEDWKQVTEKADKIFKQFADIKDKDPACEEAQELVKAWQQYITDTYYNCTKEILAGLGMMYVADERFTKNLDQHGEGTAKFMSDAIACYCKE